MYHLGTRSRANLQGVHPDLVRVVELAITLTRQDFSVAEGLRTPEQARENARKGTGIVNSLHIRQPSGFGHAVDLWPHPLDWKDLPAFREVARAMFAAADRLSVLLQWGADWDVDGAINEPGEWDFPHFQLPQPWRLKTARLAAERRIAARAAGEDVIA